MFPKNLKDKNVILIFVISFLIAISLTVACWNINFWPTDAEVYYMPAAKELPQLKYLSQIHQSLDEERIKWLHGKEFHVLAISLVQRFMGDTQTLRPLLLLGIFCIFGSSVLLFAITRRLWGERSALLAWFLFASSFWPYLYILFAKHQTQGLFFFLLSLACVLYARSWIWYVLAGMSMAVSVFSSTVSMLYCPYILAALVWQKKDLFKNCGLCIFGFAIMLIWANYPDVIGNLKSYWQYIRISGESNHFFYNQRVLAQWLPHFDLKNTRGGIVWILKYFMLAMPIIFPAYIASVAYLLAKHWNMRTLLLVGLSMIPVVLAEIKGVAQYGANYFPAFFGIIMLICYAVKLVIGANSLQWKKWGLAFIGIHLALNAYIFMTDIYPSRMATTLISQTLYAKGITQVATLRSHPLRRNIIDNLNPSTLKHLNLVPIDSIMQQPKGFILLPPVSTDSIYRGSNGDYTDYDEDLVLNQIVRQGRLKDYAVASFKTLSSSLIWSQEEEILAYRYLVLNQFPGDMRGRAWLLDAAKIQADLAKFVPTLEDMFLYQNHVRNIGTKTPQVMFTGYQGAVGKASMLKGVAVRIFKMNNPQDNLRAFVFRVDDKQPMWVPYDRNFISQPLVASAINNNPATNPVVFTFNPPIDLHEGMFSVVVYRDGEASDVDFYRIWADVLGRMEE